MMKSVDSGDCFLSDFFIFNYSWRRLRSGAPLCDWICELVVCLSSLLLYLWTSKHDCRIVCQRLPFGKFLETVDFNFLTKYNNRSYLFAAPGSPPVELRAQALTSHTVKVSWEPPREPNGEIKVIYQQLVVRRMKVKWSQMITFF